MKCHHYLCVIILATSVIGCRYHERMTEIKHTRRQGHWVADPIMDYDIPSTPKQQAPKAPAVRKSISQNQAHHNLDLPLEDRLYHLYSGEPGEYSVQKFIPPKKESLLNVKPLSPSRTVKINLKPIR